MIDFYSCIGMVSSKKGQSVNGKSGLSKAEAVHGKIQGVGKEQFQSKYIQINFVMFGGRKHKL